MGELLERVDSRELAEWQAFDRLDPIGEERADLRIGNLAAMYANAHRKKASREFTPLDFLWCDHEHAQKYDTPEAMKAHLRIIAQIAKQGRKRR